MELRSLAWICRKHRGLWEWSCRATLSRASASRLEIAGNPLLIPCCERAWLSRSSNVPPAGITQPGSKEDKLPLWLTAYKGVLSFGGQVLSKAVDVGSMGSHVKRSMRIASWNAHAHWSACASAGPQMTRLHGLASTFCLESGKSTCTYLWTWTKKKVTFSRWITFRKQKLSCFWG